MPFARIGGEKTAPICQTLKSAVTTAVGGVPTWRTAIDQRAKERGSRNGHQRKFQICAAVRPLGPKFRTRDGSDHMAGKPEPRVTAQGLAETMSGDRCKQSKQGRQDSKAGDGRSSIINHIHEAMSRATKSQGRPSIHRCQ